MTLNDKQLDALFALAKQISDEALARVNSITIAEALTVAAVLMKDTKPKEKPEYYGPEW
jgi:phage gp46-like protein